MRFRPFSISLLFLCSFFIISCNGNRAKERKLKRQVGIAHTRGNPKDTFNQDDSDAISIQGVGIPTSSCSHDTIVYRHSYILSFNKDTQCANWVMWHLSAAHTDGRHKRKGIPYKEDDDIAQSTIKLEDWEGVEGYDHGHMCPAGDNKWNRTAMEQTFFLSNMCVQNSRLNQETWERLESTCREWAKAFQDIYIVCGPIFSKKSYKKIGVSKKLVVPDAFYKVILCLNGQTKGIGFIYNNQDPNENDHIEDHVVSIKEIEKLTGIDFFPALQDSIEDEIENNPNINDWRIYK